MIRLRATLQNNFTKGFDIKKTLQHRIHETTLAKGTQSINTTHFRKMDAEQKPRYKTVQTRPFT